MKLKKSVLTVVTLTCAMAALSASAIDLTTTNHTGDTDATNLYSSVKLTTGSFAGKCATSLLGGSDAWTGPNKPTTVTPWAKVALMCVARFPCTAELFLGDADAQYCQNSPTTTNDTLITMSISADGTVSTSSSTYADDKGNLYDITGGNGTFTMTKHQQ